MNKAFIVRSVRTPIGSFGGVLSSLSAIELGAKVIEAVIKKSNLTTDQVDEVFFGSVCQANLGQAPARQAALKAGISNRVPCTTINKVCSSGMKSIMFAAQSIMCGHQNIIVAGGMESMSNVPYYIPRARWGYKYGHAEIIDGLQKDGLTDAFDHLSMGICADRTAEKYKISREKQDEFAIQSYNRSSQATALGKFKDEIIPVLIPQRKGEPVTISDDEEYKKVIFEKIPKLRPAFSSEGTVTAANASTLNDGASALIIASEWAIREYGLTPSAEILSFADAAQEPQWFTTAPALAAPLAIQRANLKKDDVELYEVNEAFAVVTLAFNQTMGISDKIVNIHGGAVSLGHPLGASGARIVTTLDHALGQEGKSIGLATLCNGGGGASAIVIKKV